MDKIERSGIRLGEMIDKEIFKDRLFRQVERKNEIIEKIYGSQGFDQSVIYETYCEYAEKLKQYVADTTILVHEAMSAGEKVLFEGAQGTLLDIDLGTYPYVTSSHPTSGGFCIGAGIGPNKLQEIIGVVKAYTTRVGLGPFPTELDNEVGDLIRVKGNEFGTTTGRPRRCGWFDGVMVKYTTRINGLTSISLMLLDVLSGFEKIKICTGYEIDGKVTEHFPANLKALGKSKPVYEELDGWEEDITKVERYEDLPENAKKYIARIEEYVGLPVKIVSVGPKRNQTIVRESIF